MLQGIRKKNLEVHKKEEEFKRQSNVLYDSYSKKKDISFLKKKKVQNMKKRKGHIKLF